MKQRISILITISGGTSFLMSLGEVFIHHTTWIFAPNEIAHLSFILATFGFTIYGALMTEMKKVSLETVSEQKLSEIQQKEIV